jgi:class 3 adenylate cyclase
MLLAQRRRPLEVEAGMESSDHPLPTGTITFLLTDIQGSTPLWGRDPDAMREAVARHHAILCAAAEESSGRVFRIVGDEFRSPPRCLPKR